MNSFIKSLMGLIFGLFLSLLICAFLGESPVHVLKILFSSAFGSKYDFGLTLFYCTSLIFSGASVAVAFHAGLFNIGAEGQLTIAALAMSAAALTFSFLPFPLSILIVCLISVLAGGIWGLFVGLLKAYRGAHEVIVTMMLNFIAAGLSGYLILTFFKNPESQNAESAVFSPNFSLAQYDPVQKIFGESPVNFSILLAIILLISLHIFLFKTRFGFNLRAVGENPTAAKIFGVNTQVYIVIAFALAGACAGLVPINDIIGSTQQFKIGFSPEYGFVGIAVALLASNKPLGILFSAFLFSVLQKGSIDLDFESEIITRDYARILQACLIFGVISTSLMSKKIWRQKK